MTTSPQKKPRRAFVVTLAEFKDWWDQIKQAQHPPATTALDLPGGEAAGVQLEPTWVGPATEKKTPFVEDRLDVLYDYYPGYRQSGLYEEWVAYATVELLTYKGQGLQGTELEDFSVSLLAEPYRLPAELTAHRQQALQLFKDLGKITKIEADGVVTYENNISARIMAWSSSAKRITVQRAEYFDQVGTNLTLDWASGCLGGPLPPASATLRNTFEPPRAGRLPSLAASRLANTLGVAAVVYTSDERLIIPVRNSDQAVMTKGKLHCSASGVFKLEHLQAQGAALSFEGFQQGMREEIRRELGLADDLYTLAPLAFARELARGGKPQLFFGAHCNLPFAEVEVAMESAEEKWEFIDLETLDEESFLRHLLDNPQKLLGESSLDKVEEHFTSEGWLGLRLMYAYLTHEVLAWASAGEP